MIYTSMNMHSVRLEPRTLTCASKDDFSPITTVLRRAHRCLMRVARVVVIVAKKCLFVFQIIILSQLQNKKIKELVA